MKYKYTFLFSLKRLFIFIMVSASVSNFVKAQTPTDGRMMGKGKLCNLFLYSHDQWDQYWEGTLERENANMGTVTTERMLYMTALGVTDNLNIMAGLPYVSTKASAGTLRGMSGIQDLSVDVKWRPVKTDVLFGTLSVMTTAGFSTPLSNYPADFLPMSIGLQSTTGSLRGIVHYRTKTGVFATVQGGYIRRNNIKVDRDTYYTDKQYYTNEVEVPDAINFSASIGYYSPTIYGEIVYDNFYSLSGTDIRRNDMPFPSNAMRMTRAGFNLEYRFKKLPNLGIHGSAFYTITGRNVGKSTAISAGLSYILNLWKSE